AGTLHVTVGSRDESVSLRTEQARGWTWVRAGEVALSTGTHHARLKFTGELSAVDAIAVVAPTALRERIATLRGALDNADLVSGGSWLSLAGSERSGSVNAFRDGTYRVVVRSGAAGPPFLALDGRQVALTASGSGWLVSDQVRLAEGAHALTTSGLEGSDTVLLWRPARPDEAWDGADQVIATVSSTSAFGSHGAGVALIKEPFNRDWVMKEESIARTAIRANGVVNAFVLGGGGSASLEFAPQRWIIPGRIVSSAGFLMLAIVLYVTRSRRRPRRA
ncbi:MAG: hypothetical protein ACRDJM_02190, partial [Actinomycetota bacterium]